MSLGTLKLYNIYIILAIGIFFGSCSYKFSDLFSNKEKKENINKKKDIVKKKIVEKEKIVITKPIVKKHAIKKERILTTKPIVKKEVVKKIQKQHIIKKEKVIITKPIIKNKLIIKKEIKPKKISYKKVETSTKKNKNKKIIKKVNFDKNTKLKISSTSKTKNLEEFKFDFIKKGIQDDNTLLVIGGIQGDEPGGFMAASLIATHYDIKKGSVWVVPNLNFYSIIKRGRAPFGDMNRKFANLSKNDPEYNIVQRIKSYIVEDDVKLILNLHDGSGFYRPMYIDKNHQPNKWGQSIVIDQEVLQNVEKYADTYTISQKITKHLNNHLLKKEDFFRTKNTHTRLKKTYEEQEMAKTLTYFAINNGKSAFGHETSKSLNVTQRVYYKLLAIEKYMDIMGIEYKRKFKMTESGVRHALNDDVSIKFDGINVTMPLKNIRNYQKYFPINKDGIVKYLPSNPLIKIIKTGKVYTVFYGNRRLTKLEADYSEHLNFNTTIDFVIDGKNKKVRFGETIDVKNNFIVKKSNTFRVNVIGYKNKTNIEYNVKIKKSYMIKKYSIERKGKLYRVEFYKGKNFAGMILINYTN